MGHGLGRGLRSPSPSIYFMFLASPLNDLKDTEKVVEIEVLKFQNKVMSNRIKKKIKIKRFWGITLISVTFEIFFFSTVKQNHTLFK